MTENRASVRCPRLQMHETQLFRPTKPPFVSPNTRNLSPFTPNLSPNTRNKSPNTRNPTFFQPYLSLNARNLKLHKNHQNLNQSFTLFTSDTRATMDTISQTNFQTLSHWTQGTLWAQSLKENITLFHCGHKGHFGHNCSSISHFFTLDTRDTLDTNFQRKSYTF